MPTSIFTAALIAAIAFASVNAQDCIQINNPGFEQDGVGARIWLNGIASGWTSNTDPNPQAKVISQNTPPWGGLSSGSGRNFGGLQRAGTTLSQQLSGLEVGARYKLSFLSADRPGYGGDEQLRVSIGNQVVVDGLHPFPQFTRHQVEFVAQAETPTLTFMNVHATQEDRTVFIDDITLCKIEPTCVAVGNPGFELNAINQTFIGDQYAQLVDLADWEQTDTTRAHIVRQGSPLWGGLNSGDGGFYVSLQSVGQIQQRLTGLISGRSYRLSFLCAERPAYGVSEEVVATVITNRGQNSLTVNPYSDFVSHTVDFVAGSINTIRFQQTTAGDTTAFLDAVTVCELPTTTTTGTRTTTTVTQTTDTVFALTVEELRSQLADQLNAQNQLQATVAAMSTQLATNSEVQSNLVTQVGSISDAIRNAVRTLPRFQSGSRSCQGSNCLPQVEANGRDLHIRAGDSIQLETECGVINPCDLWGALDALRLP